MTNRATQPHAHDTHPRETPTTEKVSASAQPWVLAATILGSSIAFINGSTVNVALPALQRDLSASVSDIQWITNSYTLFLAALILLGGSLGDHYGRKRIFMVGIVVFTLASVWCGFALDAGQLIIARAVQGIGGALLTPGSLAIIGATFPSKERGRAIGLWSGFSSLTSAVGPLLGGWLIDTVGWRWIFFMLVPMAAIALAITARFVPESRDEEAMGGLDWGGAFLATVGLGALTYGFIESSKRGLSHPLVLTMLGVGIVLLIVFIVYEARHKSPMVPLKLFESRPFSGTNALTFFLYMALGGALFFVPLNLIQIQGYTATESGAAFLPFILLMSVLSRWAGGLVDSVGAKLPLVVGPLITAGGFLLLAVPGIGGSYWTTFFPAMVALGFGMSIAVAPLTTTVMNAVPTHYAGTASGINNAVARVANLLAVALLGVVVFAVFNSALTSALQPLELPSAALTALDAERSKLAAAEAPADLPEETRQQVTQAIDESFIASFRVVAYIAAGLGVASAVVAWFTVDGKVKPQEEAT